VLINGAAGFVVGEVEQLMAVELGIQPVSDGLQ
jgi:hypothetical protein